MRVSLNRPQNRFLQMPQKFRAMVCGYGTGKTWGGCVGMLSRFWEYPGVPQGYFAPTFPQIRDIFYPTVEEVADTMGLRADVRLANKEVHFYSGRQYRGTTICRSMDRPGTIVGFKIGHAFVDEIDTLPMTKAQDAWRKIIARLRQPNAPNGADVTTTPEGFRFVYRQFEKAVRENPALSERYAYTTASTYENAANLPEDYIPSLMQSYTPELIEAYINGQFVNLTSGTVYHKFDRNLNACTDTVRQGERVYIGIDFNVGQMAAVVHVLRNGQPRAVDEIVGAFDTPDMIKRIKDRYWEYQDGEYRRVREIVVYPDASGKSRKTVNASETDIALLRLAGFRVKARDENPPVRDRINAMNAMFCNALGERRYLVSIEKCPVYVECLEQQAYKNGEPDKESGLDHLCDSAGYYLHFEFPIKHRKAAIVQTAAGFY